MSIAKRAWHRWLTASALQELRLVTMRRNGLNIEFSGRRNGMQQHKYKQIQLHCRFEHCTSPTGSAASSPTDCWMRLRQLRPALGFVKCSETNRIFHEAKLLEHCCFLITHCILKHRRCCSFRDSGKFPNLLGDLDPQNAPFGRLKGLQE